MAVSALDPSSAVKSFGSGLKVDVEGLIGRMKKQTPADALASRKTAAAGMRELATRFLDNESPTWRENARFVLAMLDKGVMPGGAPNAPPINIETGKELKLGWKP